MQSNVIIPIVLIALLLPIYVINTAAPSVGMRHDDGIYVVTAKALAEGKGYKIVSLPIEVRQTKYPIAFPLLLSFIWKAFPKFPDNLQLLKLVPAVSTLIWLTLCYRFLRQRGNLARPPTLWIVLFTAGSPWVVYSAALVMTDTLFAALSLATLMFLLKAEESKEISWRHVILAAFLGGSAFLTRTAGMALLFAGIIGFLRKRRYREALCFGTLSVIPIISWWVWQATLVASETSIEAYYTAENYRDWNLLGGNYALIEAANILFINFCRIGVYPVHAIGVPYVYPILCLTVGIASWCIMLNGTRRINDLGTVHLYLVISVGMVLLWAWEPDRFLIPLLPFLLLYGYRGLTSRVAKLVLVSMIVPVLFVALFRAASITYKSGVANLAYTPSIDWKQVSAIHEWIRQNTDADAIIAANFDPAIYLYTGRKAIRPFVVDNTRLYAQRDPRSKKKFIEMDTVLRKTGARYLVETSHDTDEEPEFKELLAYLTRAGRARLIKEFAPDYCLYALSF